MKRSALLLVALLAARSAGPQPVGVEVTVAVSGGDANAGQVIISLFDSKRSWMKQPLLEQIVPVDGQGEAIHVFARLSPGHYAVVVVYDIDSDGELDTGIFGVPREKIGFSNGAVGRLGPASWDDAMVEISADAVVEIQLSRAKR